MGLEILSCRKHLEMQPLVVCAENEASIHHGRAIVVSATCGSKASFYR